MAIERFVVTISKFSLRKPIKRVCHSAEAVDRLIASYKRRQPSTTISVRRKRLMLEVVDGDVLVTQEYSDLPVNVPIRWEATVAKATLTEYEKFEATVEMVDERISAAKEDPSIVVITLWLVTDYP